MRTITLFLLISCLALAVVAKPAQHQYPIKPHQQHHHHHHQQQQHHQHHSKPTHAVHHQKPIGGAFEDVYLVNGIPTSGYGRTNNSWVYYIFNIPTTNRAAIQTSVTPLFGNPALYISCDMRPTLTNFTWSATSVMGPVTYVVSHAQLDSSCTSGHMYIGIYTSAPSDFEVESNTLDVLIQLQDGVAQMGVAGPAATYFQYIITGNLTNSTDTTVEVTPLMGIPTLYIQCGDVPTMSNYKWKSDTASGLQTIRIAPTDLCTDQTLWIGIYSLPSSDSSSFEITVTSGAVATELQGGKAVRGVNVGGQYTDYIYNFLPGTTLSFEATLVYGSTMTIYGACGYAPRENDSQFSATVVESGSVELIISSTDPNYCINGVIYISTTSPNAHSYVMVASGSNDLITMVNGYTLYDKLKAGQYNYYTIAIPSGALNLATTFLNGDGQVYVSCTNMHPSATDYDYTGDYLQLDHLASTCAQLYISVSASFDTSYLLVGYHPTSTVQLLDQVKQHDLVAAGKTAYYQLTLGQNEGASVSVLSLSQATLGLEYQFYMSCTVQHPSASVNTWASQGGENQNQQIIISSSDTNVCKNYYIAVIASLHNTQPLEFIISGAGNGK